MDSAAAAILAAAAAAATGKAKGYRMKQHFAPFIDDLRVSHGRNLVSVILYGSAAVGDFIPKKSDYNILVALNAIEPKDLRDAHACVREWHKLGHPVPVYFTVSELQNAADVFPIEFHQMTEAHKVLYGTDVLAGLEIHDDFLRHQVEYELRSKVLRLRREYIPASASVDGMKYLMSASLPTIAALFRAVLLLHGIDPPATKHEIVARTVQQLDLDGIVFEKIFNIREDNLAEVLDEASANDLFGRYLKEIEKVVGSVDAVKGN